MTAEPLWQLSGVRFLPGHRDDRSGVDLKIPGQPTAVLGFSGAGKTSLLNVLVGFTKPAGGTVRGPRQLAWVPQEHGLWQSHSVIEHLTAVGATSSAARQLLADFDLAERADAKPGRLSVGECSRLAVARALAQAAPVLVMDEPLAHVDSARVGKYWRVIREQVARSGAALLFATHQPELVLAEATYAVCLRDGGVIYEGSVADLYNHPPTLQAASCLGPANWLSSHELAAWLNVDAAGPRCLRPERLVVEHVESGRFELVAHRFCGAHAESEVRDAQGGTLTVVHRPPAALTVGQRVNMRVIAN